MRRAHWLLVEDNDAEAELAREALSHIGDLQLSIATSGPEALRRLRGASESLPSLILLDLNLPGLSGFDVLKELRADRRLRHIPVVVLSSSDQANDIAAVYAAGANSYLVKPMQHADFVSLIEEITRYWLKTASLPS